MYPIVAWEDRPPDPIPVLRRHWKTLLVAAFGLIFISWLSSLTGLNTAYAALATAIGHLIGTVIGGDLWRNRPRFVAYAGFAILAAIVLFLLFGDAPLPHKEWLFVGLITGLGQALGSWWGRQRQEDREAH
ncbi:MAG: hypothetical protein ACREOH_21495 [Candidatus Entotheonellia bacterium]